MRFLYLICSQKLLIIVFWAWFLTQIIKVIISIIKEKKLRWRRFLQPGGMPSSHAAAVVALLTGVGIKEGIESTIFVITLVFALAIMYEAMGVRREVGEQAKLLNKILWHLPHQNFHKYKLREELGHTLIEVLTGAVLGLLIALLWM